MNRRNFNMIEILLAMSVIAIGFLGVISLLSIGLRTHRKAQDNFYVTLAAETMANYVKAKCEQYDLTIYLDKAGNKHAKTRSYGHDSGYLTADEMKIRDNKTDKTAEDIGNLGLPKPLEFEECDFDNGKKLIPDKMDSNYPTSLTVIRSGKANPLGAKNAKKADNYFDTMSKYHFMEYKSYIDNEELVEFDCIATVAITPYVSMQSASKVMMNATNKDASMLLVRIEWPAEAKVGDRNSREFQYYVY